MSEIESVSDARVVESAALSPIEVLALVLTDACQELGIELEGGVYDNEVDFLRLAASLMLGGQFPLPKVDKWASLIEPGDVIDGRVVIRARSSASTRGGANVEITTALPVITGLNLKAATWVDERVDAGATYANVRVIEHLWPTAW